MKQHTTHNKHLYIAQIMPPKFIYATQKKQLQCRLKMSGIVNAKRIYYKRLVRLVEKQITIDHQKSCYD